VQCILRAKQIIPLTLLLSLVRLSVFIGPVSFVHDLRLLLGEGFLRFALRAQNIRAVALIKCLCMTGFLETQLESLSGGHVFLFRLSLVRHGIFFFGEEGLNSTVGLTSSQIFFTVLVLLHIRVLREVDTEVDLLIKSHVGIREEVGLEGEFTFTADSLLVDNVDGSIVFCVVFVFLFLKSFISSEPSGVHEYLISSLGVSHDDVPGVLLQVGEVSRVDIALLLFLLDVLVLNSELHLNVVRGTDILFFLYSDRLSLVVKLFDVSVTVDVA